MDTEGLIKGFRNKRVFVLGDVMVDKYIFGKVSRVSPEAPVPVVDVSMESEVLGGAANVVNVLNMAESSVYASGVVGNDDPGRTLISKLKNAGVDSKGMVVDKKRPTTVKTRVIAHNQQVVRVDRESKEEISKIDVDKLIKYFKSVVKKIDGVVISDYTKGTLTSNLITSVIEVARKNNRKVIVNTKAENLFLYRGVDAVVLDLSEAALASGINPINETSVRNMGNKILSLLECSSVVITRGVDGFSIFDCEGLVLNVKGPDLGGVYEFKETKDTALSFLSLCLFSGLDLLESARFANYVVELLASKTSTQGVTLEDLRESLELNPLD